MSKHGWISLHRKIQSHWLFNDAEKLRAWIIILLEVNHKAEKVNLKNELVTCERGESLKSLDTWSKLFDWNKSKTRRFFDLLESDTMIIRKSTHKTTHLKVLNYDSYQDDRHTDGTQTARRRHTGGTQAAPNNNDNNDNNDNNNIVEQVVEYLNLKAEKDFKPSTKQTREHINARVSEGFTLDDFKKVIDTKASKWKNDAKMSDFLRPQTLFNTKFESYLNEKIPQNEKYNTNTKRPREREEAPNVIKFE
jgi:uncharacterized phage protein (TIGR02220 family)